MATVPDESSVLPGVLGAFLQAACAHDHSYYANPKDAVEWAETSHATVHTNGKEQEGKQKTHIFAQEGLEVPRPFHQRPK